MNELELEVMKVHTIKYKKYMKHRAFMQEVKDGIIATSALLLCSIDWGSLIK